MKRKGLAIILAFCLVISLVPVLASAATTTVTKLTLPDKILLSTNSRFSVNVPVEKEPSDANQQISWNIKDEDYVDVDEYGDEAILKGLKSGKTILTVNAGKVYSNECEITVVTEETLEMVKDEVTLVEGDESVKLAYNYVPGEKQTNIDPDDESWVSSKRSVANVDQEGNVTPVSEGETTIFVNKGNADAASCKVIVLAKHKVSVDDSNKDDVSVETSEKVAAKGKEVTINATPANVEDFYVQEIKVVGDDSGEEIGEGFQNENKEEGKQRVVFDMPDEDVTVYVTVAAFDPDKKPLKSISIVPEKLTMPKDTKYALSVTYNPTDTTESKDVTWESMDDKVVSVDKNGVITALSEGSTAVTAKVGKVEASINITVSGAISNLTIDSKAFELKAKEEKALKVKYTPSQPSGLIADWSSSDESVATVDNNGTVKGVSEGKATITAKLGGKTASVAVTVTKLVGDYDIVVKPGNNGKVETSATTADKGDIVVLTVKPDEGYSLGQLTVVDDKANPVKVKSEKDNEFTFEMPDSDVVVTAAFSKKGSGRFVDVPAGIWYEEAVNYVADKGYLDGVGNNRFDPNGRVTRGQLCTILYAMEGKPLVTAGSVFPDVAASKYYYDPVRWAATNGMVAGYTDGTFKPEVYVSRQQLAAVLHKYTAYKGFDTSATANIKTFADYSSVSNYAVTPLSWAVSHKVMSGTNTNRLEPLNAATRAEFAVMLKAYDANVRK